LARLARRPAAVAVNGVGISQHAGSSSSGAGGGAAAVAIPGAAEQPPEETHTSSESEGELSENSDSDVLAGSMEGVAPRLESPAEPIDSVVTIPPQWQPWHGGAAASSSSTSAVPAAAPEAIGPKVEDGQVPPTSLADRMSAYERRRQQRAVKRPGPKVQSSYTTSPGAISSVDRDALKHQGKFDMTALIQARLRGDQYTVIADFNDGRVLFSSEAAEHLLARWTPLLERNITEFIFEQDRLAFFKTMLYFSTGQEEVMSPVCLRIHAADGLRWAVLSGEQLAGSWWWLEFNPGAPVETAGGGGGQALTAASLSLPT